MDKNQPWHLGTQNDQLYVVAGEVPARNNDDSRSDADRTVIAKVYTTLEDGYLLAAAKDLQRELAHLVRLMEPKEREGGFDIPGLATLNGARAALAKARKADTLLASFEGQERALTRVTGEVFDPSRSGGFELVIGEIYEPKAKP